MEDCGLRGLALLDHELEFIEGRPHLWHQNQWRCPDGQCVASLACTLAGREWLGDPGTEAGDYLALLPGEEPDAEASLAGIDGIHPSNAARSLLGLGADHSWRLFAWGLTLEDLKAARDLLARDGLIK